MKRTFQRKKKQKETTSKINRSKINCNFKDHHQHNPLKTYLIEDGAIHEPIHHINISQYGEASTLLVLWRLSLPFPNLNNLLTCEFY
jgi:hypothetical protein